MPRSATALPAPDGPLAAIDMGSNSFRLEIGQVRGHRYQRQLYLKDTVRLGAGLDEQQHLTEEAMERGLASLRRFAEHLGEMAPGQVRAVATQTLREARNRNAFLLRAEAALGQPIEVISGREEARLIYAGVSFLQPASTPRLVIDIGGRSTEMILGQGRTPGDAESFQIGSVSLSLRHFPDGRLTTEAFRDAQVAAGAEVEEALAEFAPGRWEQALGSSGTAGAVADVLRASKVSDGTITPAGLRWLIERCLEAGHVDRLDLPGLKPERRAVLPGGVAILYTLAAHFRIERLLPAKGALRQGVIVDLHDRLLARQPRARSQDLREETVRALQQRFQVDGAQALRVGRAAMDLHAQCAGDDDGDAESLDELRWAAALHEIGLMVSHHDHHRHSAYLLAHVDAAGFSQSQQRRIADLVLGQRGGLRKLEAALQRPAFAVQLLALRLAAIACHARQESPPAPFTLRRRGGAVRVVPGRGLSPRTLYLLQQEADAWSRSGVLDLQLAG
jgi:exopolyphosphatase/guanosine-5'-triphosphate,3'-diphosphate pyrophosphatase